MSELKEDGHKSKNLDFIKESNEIQGSLFPHINSATRTNGQDNARAILNREGLTFCYIRDPKEATKAVAKLLEGPTPVALDTETAKLPGFTAHTQAGLEPHLSRVRLIQLYGGGDAIYVFDMFALNMGLLKPISVVAESFTHMP